MFEACALAILSTAYVLLYNVMIGIATREKLEKHSQLLEMHSHQFLNLQEYMKHAQTPLLMRCLGIMKIELPDPLQNRNRM